VDNSEEWCGRVLIQEEIDEHNYKGPFAKKRSDVPWYGHKFASEHSLSNLEFEHPEKFLTLVKTSSHLRVLIKLFPIDPGNPSYLNLAVVGAWRFLHGNKNVLLSSIP
jgi:hypothetical protein